MSKGQTLRALVNKRLAAAAEDIFVLIERTIAEYEEELCRSREENQRKQQLLDSFLIPRVEGNAGNVQVSSASPGPSVSVEIPGTSGVKEESEEQSVKPEDELLVPVPESSAVCVKNEESSLLQQRQAELREETQDISSDPHFHSETEGHTDNDSDPPMETDKELHKKHGCFVCNKRFWKKRDLEVHFRIHSGEKPFRCLICDKSYSQKQSLDYHIKRHTGEKPYSCSRCEKRFIEPSSLKKHERTHTGEKPYCCSVCKKRFSDSSAFKRHSRTHTEQKPYCSICQKYFVDNYSLKRHGRLHTDLWFMAEEDGPVQTDPTTGQYTPALFTGDSLHLQ